MAARNNITLPSDMYTTIEALEERYKNFANLDDFLNYFVRLPPDQRSAVALRPPVAMRATGERHS